MKKVRNIVCNASSFVEKKKGTGRSKVLPAVSAMQRVLLAALVLGALLCVVDARQKGPNPPRRKVDSNTQLTAVTGLISRFVSKDVAASFDLAIISQQNNKDVMQITPLGKGRIQLSGSSGVAVAAAFYWYLKVHFTAHSCAPKLTLQNACNAMITWNQTQINISTPLPQISGTVMFVTPYTFRYYYNVCTFGYTSVWYAQGSMHDFGSTLTLRRWNWARWQRELDWAAMNGRAAQYSSLTPQWLRPSFCRN